MLFHRTAVRLTAALLCASLIGLSASADGGGTPVFSEELTGICVTQVPETGTVLLGDRVIRGGDVAVSAWAKEGLIPQSSAKKAVNAALKALGLL
jgi:hypothetical protein